MEEERCGPQCRVFEPIVLQADENGKDLPTELTITIRKICNHPDPRIGTDQPRQIRVTWDEGGLQCWAAFKAQCRDCRKVFGGLWLSATPPAAWPPDPTLIRAAGARLLVADGCLEDDDGWRCAACLGVPSDRRLLIVEGVLPVPMEGWPSAAGG